MDLNANDLASINIMEYSLCLDDHPTPPLKKQSSSLGNGTASGTKMGNFSKLKSSILSNQTSNNEPNVSFKFDKQNTFNSFYLTNDYDSGDIITGNNNSNNFKEQQTKKFQKIDHERLDADIVEEDEDEVVLDSLKGHYELKTNAFQQNDNKREIKSNQFSNVITSSNSNISSIGATHINNNNVIELGKHKLSSIWNNVKYGWANYLKKPNKIELNSHEPIYILGKKFFYNESEDDDNNDDSMPTNNNNIDKNFYDYFDALNKSKSHKQPTNKNMNSLNESYFNAPSLSSILSSNEYDDTTKHRPILSKPFHSINSNDDYLAMNYSYLSTSPFETNNLASVFGKSSQFSRENSFKSKNNSNNINRKANSEIQLNSQNIYERFLNENMKSLLDQEIYSRLWFTYRKDFEPLDGNTKYTTDCGWGCMLRSAQMLIAQGLLMHLFNNDWSLYKSLNSNKNYNLYKEVICLFNDRPSLSCPFGLHRLLNIADEKLKPFDNDKTSSSSKNGSGQAANSKLNNTRVGTWFGPTSVCLLMKDALNESLKKPSAEILNNIQIYVAQDCTIFKQDIIDMCSTTIPLTKNSNTESDTTGVINAGHPSSTTNFIPCILLISARLGGEELNEIYVDSLKMFLELDICIGIIGGKPKHSLYFLGYQGDKVIYLDPHFCQPTINVYSNSDKKQQQQLSSSLTQLSVSSYDTDTCLTTSSVSSTTSDSSDLFDNSSFHCGTPSKIAFNKLDPSIAIGFYCRTLNDLNRLCDSVKESSLNERVYPIFGVSEGRFEDSQVNYQAFNYDEKLLTTSQIGVEDENAARRQRQLLLKQPPNLSELISNKMTNNTSVKNEQVKNNSTLTSYLTSKLANKTASSSASNDGRRNLFSNIGGGGISSSSNSNKGIMSPSKSKKGSKKSTDPDDFVLV